MMKGASVLHPLSTLCVILNLMVYYLRQLTFQARRKDIMSTIAKPLQELVQELPHDMRAEVRDFIEFLLAKRGRRVGTTLRQDWAGALRDYRQQYTSLELQHHALAWPGD